jgi:cephalosporin hydroxylase
MMMGSKGRYRYAKQWEAFADVVKSGIRPKTFERCWSYISDKVSGQYESEARALWNVLQTIKPESIVEVGRNLGGTLWMFACACPQLKEVLSLDIEWYDTTDNLWVKWFADHDVQAKILECDSTKHQAFGMYDFVFIDGLHTGEAVAADIQVWRDHARYIAFHDYADRGANNKHKRVFPDVVYEISKAAQLYGWQQVGERGRSEIVFETGIV